MHIVSLYRKRSRELHGGKGKGCWKVWPGSGLYFKTLIGFFFNFFINFLSFHVILHYNIYSLITNSTCTDKYQTNYQFNKLLLERLIITFTSNGIREFVPLCRLLFIISAHKLVVSLNFLSIWIFWAVFICSFSILRNSQLDWRLPFAVCCGRHGSVLSRIALWDCLGLLSLLLLILTKLPGRKLEPNSPIVQFGTTPTQSRAQPSNGRQPFKAPLSTYKFSRLISIHSRRELVGRIW